MRCNVKTPHLIVSAGFLGVLAAGMLVHHAQRGALNGSPPPQAEASQEVTSRARRSNGRSGWIARPESPLGSDRTSRRSAAGVAFDAAEANRGRDDVARGIHAPSTVAVRHTGAVVGSHLERDSAGAVGVEPESGQPEDVTATPSEDAGPTYDSGEEAKFSTDSWFEVPEGGNLSGKAGTISFQFEPGWSGDDRADAALVQIGDSRLVIRKHASFLRFEMNDEDGNTVGAGFSIDTWKPNQAYLVTATWDGGLMMLYVDGRVVAHQPFARQIDIPSGTPIHIGTAPQDAPVALGSLSNIQLFTQSLSPIQIAAHAAQMPRKTN
jgi:concanavalin A-like lectin/glucanase superfamily protein